jgi:hypothetical protein
MGGAPQGAMRVASQIWQVVFALQTLQVFCLAFRKKAQYVVVPLVLCSFPTLLGLQCLVVCCCFLILYLIISLVVWVSDFFVFFLKNCNNPLKVI